MDHLQEHDEGTSDVKTVRKQQKRSKLEREREVEEMRQLLAAPGNRSFVWRLLEYCRIYHSNPFPHSHGEMAYFEGRRSVGHYIIQTMLEADPNAYAVMRDEAVEKQRRLTASST